MDVGQRVVRYTYINLVPDIVDIFLPDRKAFKS